MKNNDLIFFFLQSGWLETWKTSDEFICPNYLFKKQNKQETLQKSHTRQSE